MTFATLTELSENTLSGISHSFTASLDIVYSKYSNDKYCFTVDRPMISCPYEHTMTGGGGHRPVC